ncbi:terpenoid cyclases/Protein prenyltransferase [Hypomontagnella monticulosa]|nr:terpenoid cyclases/Protein prenyltransferase [Hypomontagnella monticulosa]
MTASDQPPLDTARHIRYWQRCYRSVLPQDYTSNDSIRLTLGFFIVAALDLLSSPSSYSEPPKDPLKASLISPADRTRLRAYVLSLQHPQGGFCGSPNHVFPLRYTTDYDAINRVESARDPANANIAATFFALILLAVLAEDDGSKAFEGINREKTLRWLKTLQRDDGSFGEIIDENGFVGGGRDMRYCYLAATIRWALRAPEAGQDFDVDAMVAHIRRGQTFDGGLGESSTHESHAGYAYCAVAALSMLDLANPNAAAEPDRYLHAGIPDIPSLVHFLACRQFEYIEPDSDDEADESRNHPLPDLSTLTLSEEPQVVGFNGRLNKLADTCYVWWVSGTLSMLGAGQVIDRGPARKFIIDKTQHMIGGFAKSPGGPPDVYHAYLGLAALATMAGDEGSKEEGLGKFDPRLCIGAEAANRIAKAREALLTQEDEDSDDEWREETERIKKELDWDNLQETIARLETKWKAEGKVPMHEMDKWNPFHPPNLDDETA